MLHFQSSSHYTQLSLLDCQSIKWFLHEQQFASQLKWISLWFCLADYEEITTALSGLFLIPKAALVYAGCSKAPLALCWLVSHDLVEYIKSTTAGSLSGYRLLAEHEVTGVAVGDQMYKCPTIKVRESLSQCIVYTLCIHGVGVVEVKWVDLTDEGFAHSCGCCSYMSTPV